MTTQPFPRNKVILFAQIDQQRQSKNDEKKGKAVEPSIRRVRNVVNGSDYLVGLQVAAPYGGSYLLEVEVGRVEGADLLAQAQAGQIVVVEGHLTRTRDEDERFRDYAAATIEGVVYQDVHFQVERLRPLTDNDPFGTGSNVFLEGEVIEPPFFMRHPDYPEIELARLTIRARTRPTLSDGGLVRPGRPCEVTVIVPTEDEGAAYLYRRGNRVRVRGVIERMAMRQNRVQVSERLKVLDADWRTQRDEIRAGAEEDQEKAVRELRYQGNRYVRERERLERGARTMVLAVEITPLEGATPAGSREEVRADRVCYEQEFDANRKARNVERRERQRTNRERQQAAVREQAGAATGEDAPAEAPLTITARKLRRHTVVEQPVAISEALAPIGVDDVAPQVEAALAAVSSNNDTEPAAA
ncbi:MAG: hypothetical protein WCG26_05325 [Chloroflexales bacterium]